MHYELTADFLHPADWRVEAIDHENEGVVYVTIFTGPKARERALEYLAWKQTEPKP